LAVVIYLGRLLPNGSSGTSAHHAKRDATKFSILQLSIFKQVPIS